MPLITFIKQKIAQSKLINQDRNESDYKRVVVGQPGLSKIDITIQLSETQNEESQGNEAWFLDICDKEGNSIPGWKDAFANQQLECKPLGEISVPLLLPEEDSAVVLELPPDAQLLFLTHPWSGAVVISSAEKSMAFDLYSPAGASKLIPINDLMTEGGCIISQFSSTEDRWLENIKLRKPDIISIVNPDWRGVKSATVNLVPDCLEIQDNLSELSAEKYARLIDQTGCKKLLIGGFPLSFELLIKNIKKLQPDIVICAFWLSSFLQSNEDYAWNSFLAMNRLCKRGIIDKIGFAKKGMAEMVAKSGVNTAFVASYVRQIPDGPSSHAEGSLHIGIWALAPIWRKTPYAMLAATAMLENVTVFVVGQEARSLEFAKYFRINIINHEQPIPQDRMQQALAKMHLNLYVTLSECSPMLPLESLAAGVPCLMGPNSHLFEDHPYLHSRLVVPYPDRSDVIADMIKRALKEREQIIDEYKQYAPVYNYYARETLNDLFNGLTADPSL